jgi:hypothetical protein
MFFKRERIKKDEKRQKKASDRWCVTGGPGSGRQPRAVAERSEVRP